MSRTMHDANLHSRASRGRLRVQFKPHWCTLRQGLHLGYLKTSSGRPGLWTVRSYKGQTKTLSPGVRGGKTPYRVRRLPGVADDYQDADGETVLSFAQAQEIALAPPRPSSSGPLTVEGAVGAYALSLRQHGRERAASEASSRLTQHLGALAGRQVADLTPEALRGWLHDLAGKLARIRPGDSADRRSKVSANRVLAMLRASLNHAYHEGRVPSDAAWRRRVKPFSNVDAARSRYLSIDECRRLINACVGAFRLLVQAALHTGCRYGELTRLRVHDFDEDAGTLAVAKSKSGKPRHVHLSEEGEAFFRQLTAGRGGDEMLLRRDDGGPFLRNDQTWFMREAVQRAKIAPPISFHGLRHTYASLAIMSGASLLVVAQNLGHRDTRMCELHYGHLSASHKRDMIREHAPKFGITGDDKVTALRSRK
jgi:integrase